MIASLRVSLFAPLTPITPFTSLKTNSEPFAAAQGKLRDGPIAMGSEILRCAQDDKPPGCHPEPLRYAQGKLREEQERTCG